MTSTTEIMGGFHFGGYAKPKSSRYIAITLNDGVDSMAERDILTDSSTYFSGCLNSPWKESLDRRVMLDFDSISWCIYKTWLTSGAIEDQPLFALANMTHGHFASCPNLHSELERHGKRNGIPPTKSIDRLVRAWILGDYLGAPKFQDEVVEELKYAFLRYYESENALPWLNMKFMCDNTIPNSPLYVVVVDTIQFGISKDLILLQGEVLKFVENYGLDIAPDVETYKDLRHAVKPAPWHRSRDFYQVARK